MRSKLKGIKHLVQCHCILPQFKKMNDPIFHQFIVFSIERDGKIDEKYSNCNNCGVMHKIYDICKSEIVIGKEDDISIIGIDDIEYMIPQRLSELLRKNNCDLPTWENALFLIDNKIFNGDLIISRSRSQGQINLKILSILSENRFKIRNEIISNDIVREEIE
tara:strand:+ start:373 stop:861 length:489 start_codon:yes stop_codon:yes gene_type:complete